MLIRDAVRKEWADLWKATAIETIGAYQAAIKMAFHHSRGRPYEADCIATLILKAVPVLAKEWGVLLSRHNIEVSVAGVYCHQRPIVSYGGPKDSEIGDLLLVHVHRRPKRRPLRRAVLFQAKVSDRWTAAVAASDRHQLELYEKWPDFRFVRPIGNGLRSVRPKKPHPGAKYLLISRSWPCTWLVPGMLIASPYAVSRTNRYLVGERCLASELTAMLAVEAGRSFFGLQAASRRVGWTRVVWDLLKQSFGRRFQRTRIGVMSGDRYAGAEPAELSASAYFHRSERGPINTLSLVVGRERAESLVRGGGGDDWRREGDVPIDDEPGVSVILIESLATEEG